MLKKNLKTIIITSVIVILPIIYKSFRKSNSIFTYIITIISEKSTPNGNLNKNTFHNTNTFPEICCIGSMQKALSH